MKKLILVGLLYAAPASAEPLKLPLTFYFTSAALDLGTTYANLQYQGVGEANPLGKWLERDPGQLVVFSAIFDAGVVYGLHKVWGHKHPKWERVLLYGAGVVRLYYANQNFKLHQHLVDIHQPRVGDRYVWPTP